MVFPENPFSIVGVTFAVILALATIFGGFTKTKSGVQASSKKKGKKQKRSSALPDLVGNVVVANEKLSRQRDGAAPAAPSSVTSSNECAPITKAGNAPNGGAKRGEEEPQEMEKKGTGKKKKRHKRKAVGRGALPEAVVEPHLLPLMSSVAPALPLCSSPSISPLAAVSPKVVAVATSDSKASPTDTAVDAALMLTEGFTAVGTRSRKKIPTAGIKSDGKQAAIGADETNTANNTECDSSAHALPKAASTIVESSVHAAAVKAKGVNQISAINSTIPGAAAAAAAAAAGGEAPPPGAAGAMAVSKPTVMVSVNPQRLGALIGPEGGTLKRIEVATGCRVQLPTVGKLAPTH
jgi:hypothetical protein